MKFENHLQVSTTAGTTPATRHEITRGLEQSFATMFPFLLTGLELRGAWAAAPALFERISK